MPKYYPFAKPTPPKEPQKPEAPTCIHNDAVICDPANRVCNRCGWDPDVAKVRLLNICRQMGIGLPQCLKEK